MIRRLLDKWRNRQRWHTIRFEVNDVAYEQIQQVQLKTGLGMPELVIKAIAFYEWGADRTTLGEEVVAISPDDEL